MKLLYFCVKFGFLEFSHRPAVKIFRIDIFYAKFVQLVLLNKIELYVSSVYFCRTYTLIIISAWKVFGVNKDPLCFGSLNSFKLLKEAEEPKAECPNKELNGVSAAIGNSGRLAVHQIVGEPSRMKADRFEYHCIA